MAHGPTDLRGGHARIRAGETGGVVVAKLDRFGRILVGALAVLEEFESQPRDSRLCPGQRQPLDAGRQALFADSAGLRRARARPHLGVLEERHLGGGQARHTAKYTPVSYVKTAKKRLALGPDAEAIREPFLMRAAHQTRTAIARRLNETAPRSGGGRWTPPMVDRIIRNRIYVGHAYRGEDVNPATHPALVTAAEWHAANSAPVRAAPRGSKANPLGGLARCWAAGTCSRRVPFVRQTPCLPEGIRSAGNRLAVSYRILCDRALPRGHSSPT